MITNFALSIGFDLVDFIVGLGVFAVLLVVFAESGLLIGFFLPGDSLLFTVGLLVQSGTIPINIHLLVLLLFIAAVLGDNVGYAFGKSAGSRLFSKTDSKIFKQKHLLKAQRFYEKHGGKTIVLARFTPVVRTFAPIVAGASGMDYKKFFTYNLLGGILWTAGITYAGYYAGAILLSAGIDPDTIILPIIVFVVFISILPALYQVTKNKETRDSILNFAKNRFRVKPKSK